MTSQRKPFDSLPPGQQAGIICNDARFQQFAAHRSGFPDGRFTVTASAEFLRQQCGIDSRSQLATDTAAHARFQRLRTEFDAWAGKLPTPRD